MPVEATAIPDVLFERGLYWASGRSGVVNLEIDHAGTAARPVQAALEQHVRDRRRLHRNGRVEINLSLKHP